MPDLCVQLVLADDIPGAACQHDEEVELLGCQDHLDLVEEGEARSRLQGEHADGDLILGIDLRASPQQGGYPSHQMGTGDRLRHVVVGAVLERAHDRRVVLAGGEDEHWDVAHRPDHLQEFEAVEVGKAEVDEHAVRLLGYEVTQPLHRGALGVGLVAGLGEVATQQSADALVVFDHEEPCHG